MDLRPADNYAFEEHPYWEIWPETRPSYFARRVDNDDDLPVMGNHPHPLIYGHERVHIKHEHRKVIVSIVPEESYWMSLYRMYADQFGSHVYRILTELFVPRVQRGYLFMESLDCTKFKVRDNHKMWSLWIILSWIHAAFDWPEPPKPPLQYDDNHQLPRLAA